MRSPAPRGGHDRWLVSYADLVTLLLAFFTTLYASSSLDAQKFGPVSDALQSAFASEPGAGSIVPPVRVLPHPSLEQVHLRIAKELATAVDEHRVEIRREPRGVVVSLPDAATFAPGSAAATPEAWALIGAIGQTIKAAPQAVRIEGHTDDVPISGRYASNWELSTARASAVVAFLIEDVGLDASRLSAAGYGEFHPREANDTPEHRARNRRVDIVILDDGAAAPRMETADARP